MREMLLAVGAALVAAVPAAAAAETQSFMPPGFDQPVRMSVILDDGRPGRPEHRRRGRGLDGLWLYDRDYQGDTAWRSNSFNDWWHDRPNRSYPRWVQDNQQTCDRMWYSGNVLRC